MLLKIHHDTTYSYAGPVFFEPHEVRLRPRADAWQELREWSLDVSPAPAGRSDAAGPDGSPTTMVWFEGLHDRLDISVRSVVETRLVNPFDFLFHPPGGQTLPMRYPPKIARALAPALAPPGMALCFDWQGQALPPHNPIAALSLEVWREAGGQTLDFLTALTSRLHAMIERIVRPDGPPHPPFKTLAEGKGACRDTALLFIAVAQAQGLAARFVSGYFYPAVEGTPESHELHAWAEVFIPGAGWRGFDPTVGLTCADRHVAIAASSEPALAAPVTGTIRGSATCALTTRVRISSADAPTADEMP